MVAVPVTTNVPCMVTRLASSPTYSALTAVYVPAVRSSCTVNAPFASLVTIALLPPSGTVEIAIRSFGLAVPLTVSLFSPGVTPAMAMFTFCSVTFRFSITVADTPA